jgi:hypothetical protein
MMNKIPVQTLPQARWNKYVGYLTPQHLFATVAKGLFGSRIEIDDPAFEIGRDDTDKGGCYGYGVENRHLAGLGVFGDPVLMRLLDPWRK